jgi:tetratricopeptide (TPR) repeat protein
MTTRFLKLMTIAVPILFLTAAVPVSAQALNGCDVGLQVYLDGDTEAAIPHFTACIEQDADNDDEKTIALFRRAVAYRVLEDDDAFTEDFLEGIRLDANSTVEDPMGYWDQLVALHPTSPWAFQGRGKSHRDHERHKLALTDHGQAVTLAPDDPQHHADLGFTYQAARQFEPAIAKLTDAIKLLPEIESGDGELGGNAAQASANEDSGDAEAQENAAAARTVRAFYFNGRADIYGDLGDFGAAIADLNTALRLDPNYRPSNNGLAWIYASARSSEHRNGALAVEHALRAMESLPEDAGANAVATIRDTLAAAFAESGDFINAIKEQELAIGLAAKNDLSHYETGFAEKLALYLDNKPYVAGSDWRE